MIISINGKIVDEKKAVIPITNEAFLFGYGVFETIRTYNNKVFRLDDHLARLFVSVEMMDFKPKWGFKKAYQEVVKTLDKSPYPEAKIRIILSKTDLIIIVERIQEKTKAMYEKGVELVSFPGMRNTPRAKNVADAFCYMAKQHALKCNTYEALLVDSKNYVHECSYANIFWVNNEKLYTTNKEILFGITRETVVELAENCNFKEIKYKSLLNADEIFITQTTSGILPVSAIDGQKIHTGRPGRVTKKLMEEFKKLVWGK